MERSRPEEIFQRKVGERDDLRFQAVLKFRALIGPRLQKKNIIHPNSCAIFLSVYKQENASCQPEL